MVIVWLVPEVVLECLVGLMRVFVIESSAKKKRRDEDSRTRDEGKGEEEAVGEVGGSTKGGDASLSVEETK